MIQALKEIDDDDESYEKEIVEMIERKYRILLLTSCLVNATLLIISVVALIKLCMKTRKLK